MSDEHSATPRPTKAHQRRRAPGYGTTQLVEAPGVRGKTLFGLGSVYATPAVLRHLSDASVHPATLLASHQGGFWGDLSPTDAQANNRALRSGARILSRFVVAGEAIYVITEAESDEGVRKATTLLFAKEY